VTETHEFITRDESDRPTAEVWEIPRRVWFILLSWGLAVLVLTGLFSAWIWTAQRQAEHERDALKLQQDRAMCAMISVFLSGPEPVAGPSGDRSRAVRAGMTNYQAVLRCDQIGAAPR
jgi:hypothetical protein